MNILLIKNIIIKKINNLNINNEYKKYKSQININKNILLKNFYLKLLII